MRFNFFLVTRPPPPLADQALEEVPGLNPVTPQGAMYLMIRIDVDAFDETITDDITFTERVRPVAWDVVGCRVECRGLSSKNSL